MAPDDTSIASRLQERPHALPSDPPPGAWPTVGAIEFRNVGIRRRPLMTP